MVRNSVRPLLISLLVCTGIVVLVFFSQAQEKKE